MGTTLATVHVYKQTPQTVQAILPNACVYQISEDWTSVIDIELGAADKTARKLSKALQVPLLAFECFDDDLMTLKLFIQGKMSAQYIMTEGFDSYLKHCDQFVSALGWDEKLTSRLRRIFKCGELDRKIDMLEEFFGVAFYVHSEFLSESTEAYVRERGETQYKVFEAQQKKLSRIKNQTTAVLTQEIMAKGMPVMNRRDLFLLANRKGETYNGSECSAYKLEKDELIPILGNLRIPNSHIDLFPFMYGYNIYSLFDQLPYTKDKNSCLQVAHDGAVLNEIALPNVPFTLNHSLNNGDLICTSGKEGCGGLTTVNRISHDGSIVWSVDIPCEYISMMPLIHDEHIYLSGRRSHHKEGGILFKLDENGRVLAELDSPYFNSQTQLFFYKENIYYLGDYFANKRSNYVLIKMDKSLTISGQLELSDARDCYDGILSIQSHQVYYNELDRKLVAIDLDTMQYTVKKPDRWIALETVDTNGLLYGYDMAGGASTVCVLDSDMNLISRHCLKGRIVSIQESETGMHAVTFTGNFGAWGFKEDDCFVRVYRIDPLYPHPQSAKLTAPFEALTPNH